MVISVVNKGQFRVVKKGRFERLLMWLRRDILGWLLGWLKRVGWLIGWYLKKKGGGGRGAG